MSGILRKTRIACERPSRKNTNNWPRYNNIEGNEYNLENRKTNITLIIRENNDL